MLLIMGFTLAVISTFVEVKLVHGSKTLRRLYLKGFGPIEGVYFNTGMSFFLSYIIGVMFTADGLTVLFGGVLSTGLSQMYFSTENFMTDNGWSLTKVKRSITSSVNTIGRTKRSITQLWLDFKQPVKDVLALVLAFFRIITFPLVLLRKASVAYSKTHG